MVSAVTCAVKTKQMARTIYDWKQTDAPFFPKVRAPPYTYASVRGFENTNQKLSNIILQGYGDSGCELEFKSSILQAL